MKSSFGIAIVLCLGATVLGCGGSEESMAEPVEYDQFCAQLALAYCDGSEQCCREDVEANVINAGHASCLRIIVEEECDLSFSEQPTWYDPERAGRAIARVRDAAMGCTDPQFPTLSDLTEPQKVGAQCELRQECAKGLLCYYEGNDETGVCVAAPKEGEPCTQGCAEGLHCLATDASMTERTCVAPRKAGQGCFPSSCQGTRVGDFSCDASFDSLCAEDLYCNTDSSDPVCADKLANGQSCDAHSECQSDYCEGGVLCSDPVQDEVDTAWCVNIG